MKKIVLVFMLALMFSLAAPTTNAAERGGVIGFFAGCCFGPRAGAAYNEGKDIHWREWGLLIPVAGLVVAIMNGLDGSSGVTTREYSAKYGSTYY